MDTTEYTEKEYVPVADAPITRVELDVDSFPVVITQGEEAKLTYYEATDATVEITCADGVLKIKEDYSFNLLKHSWFQLGRWKHKYVLTLPNGIDLTLTGKSGDFTVRDASDINLVIDVANADIAFVNCGITQLDIKATNADVELTNCTGGAVRIDATNLDLEVADCRFDSLYAKGTNNDCEVKNSSVAQMEVRGTNGDYSLKNITVDTLSVHAVNLDASILIVGARAEYTIAASGRNMPTNQTGSTDKSVTLSGTTNDVKLRFTA
ncbi:MAG: DUF4097 domain-containing protein [Clostridiales bacterium]|nr:DUF4097 domain-containing protein [Clostridiales bacterium]